MKPLLSLRTLAAGSLGLVLGSQALAQSPAVPALSSRPGAAYTMYLNYGGFTYTGNWAGKAPGTVPAYSIDGNTAAFSSADLAGIRESWARTAQKYSAFNINVTTVDPAVAAGQAGTDLQRQNYYASQRGMMQSIIGGSNAWYNSGAGGVSYVGVTQNAYGPTNSQFHTNWTFPANLGGGNAKYVAEATAHEQGHGLGLDHQSDQATNAAYSTNNGASGNGSYGPIMGAPYNAQRVTWRVGSQNDVVDILSNTGMGGLIGSSFGQSFSTATPLPVIGNTVDFNLASGIIVPKNGGANGPLGVDNYTSDYFAFNTLGGSVSLTVNEGTQFLVAGQADPGTTLDSTLTIFDATGNQIGTGLSDVTTLKKSFSGSLSAGLYYARVGSRGGYTSSYEPNAPYFTMGSYFLTGSGVTAVPEPATFAAVGLGLLALARRRRKSS